MASYRTSDGDVVDRIAWRHYGDHSPATLAVIFDANPGLAGRGPVLPAGVEIELPAIVKPATVKSGVSLWD